MKRKENTGAEGEEQRAKGKGQRAEGRAQSAERKELRSKSKVQSKDCKEPGASTQKQVTNKNSTVFNIKKPSATGVLFHAEGCISESRAIRACLMIRLFNN